MEITNRPFLRWAGSKKQQLPFLREFWNDDFSRYVEPFAGSAALYFSLSPSHARLSDTNPDLIQTYRQIRSSPDEVYRFLQQLPVGRENYYAIRSIEPRQLSAAHAAARFIYLNRFCFNGLYRTNLKGQFNVPFGTGKQGQLPDQEILRSISSQFKKVTLACEDFEKALGQCKKGDFVYIDPPYAVKNIRIFRQYNAASFGTDDLERLLQCLFRLDQDGISFVVSYAYEKSFLKMFSKWKTYRRNCNRSIAGSPSKRRRVSEAVVTNITKA